MAGIIVFPDPLVIAIIILKNQIKIIPLRRMLP